MNKEKAARLLAHYMRLVFVAAELKWDSDNESEMEEIVECIINAAQPDDQDIEVVLRQHGLIT